MEWNFIIFQKDKGPETNKDIEKYIIWVPVEDLDSPTQSLVIDRYNKFEEHLKNNSSNISPFFHLSQFKINNSTFASTNIEPSIGNDQTRFSLANYSRNNINSFTNREVIMLNKIPQSTLFINEQPKKPCYAYENELVTTNRQNTIGSNSSMYDRIPLLSNTDVHRLSFRKQPSSVKSIKGSLNEKYKFKFQVFKNNSRLDIKNKQSQLHNSKALSSELNMKSNEGSNNNLDVFNKNRNQYLNKNLNKKPELQIENSVPQKPTFNLFGNNPLSVKNKDLKNKPALIKLNKRSSKNIQSDINIYEYQVQETEDCTINQNKIQAMMSSGKKIRPENLSSLKKPYFEEEATSIIKCIQDDPKMQHYRKLTSNNNIPKIRMYKKFCKTESREYKNKELRQELVHKAQITHSVPCLYFKMKECNNPDKLLIYFHANAENLCTVPSFLKNLSKYLGMPVLCPEYAGYSYYKNAQPSEDKILNDLKSVMNYVINFLGYTSTNIIILGRSLGCSFALDIAKYYNIHSCILISPFYNMKTLVYDMFGKVGSMIMKNCFKNSKKIQKVCCPTLIIHGQVDKMVKNKHGRGLFGKVNRPM